MGFCSDSRTRLSGRRHRRNRMMQKLDARRGLWGNPDAFFPNGKGGKVTAGVRALASARKSLENLRMKLRVAMVPAGAPQQPPQGLVQSDLGPGGGGSSPA
eukprot:2419729-Prymnesium_polylepis.1